MSILPKGYEQKMRDDKITHKQQLFIEEYLRCFNASQAARAAGYSQKSAYQSGWENLKKPSINEQIQQRLAAAHMSADEALKLTAEIARGDIGDLIDDNGLLDLRTARTKGMTKLIRKIKQKTITRIGKSDDDDDVEITEIEFEMYPSDAAQERILKISGKLKGDAPVINVVKGYIGINPEDWDKQEEDAEK